MRAINNFRDAEIVISQLEEKVRKLELAPQTSSTAAPGVSEVTRVEFESFRNLVGRIIAEASITPDSNVIIHSLVHMFLAGIEFGGTAGFRGNLIPRENNTYDIGEPSPGNAWKSIFAYNLRLLGVASGLPLRLTGSGDVTSAKISLVDDVAGTLGLTLGGTGGTDSVSARNNLNVYSRSETYTQAEVNVLIADAITEFLNHIHEYTTPDAGEHDHGGAVSDDGNHSHSGYTGSGLLGP